MLLEAFHRSSLKKKTWGKCSRSVNSTVEDAGKFVWAKILSFACKVRRFTGDMGLFFFFSCYII